MDSWTPAQIEIMKAGGNDACNEFLYSRGVPRNASIRDKYSSDAAALYKQVLKARAEKRPEPTQLEPVKGVATTTGTTTATTAVSAPAVRPAPAAVAGQDPNGMERLHGETDAEYIARQTRLREEAKKRMAQKFGGNSMDHNGKRIMGGIGSSPHPSSSPFTSFDVSSLTNSLSSGLGTAASGFSSVLSFASNTVHSSGAREVAKDVGNMGLELWSTISSSAKEVANNLHMESLGSTLGVNHDGNGAVDGLSALSEKMRMEKLARGNSTRTYTGFGNDGNSMNSRIGGVGVGGSNHGHGAMTGSMTSSSSTTVPTATSAAVTTTTTNSTTTNTNIITTNRAVMDPNSVAPLPGESDSEYMARQMKIREEAKAKSMANVVKVAPKTTTSSSMTKKLQVDSDDDFFASFGA